MSLKTRQNFLIENYVEAKLSGRTSGYSIKPLDDTFEHLYILIQPTAGVYKGHSYVLEMKTKYGTGVDQDKYPIKPPYIHFITPMFHVNVSANGGSICLDILKDVSKWSAFNSFDTVVQNILMLLDEPNNGSPYNGEASRIWQACEKDYKTNKTSKMSIAELDELRKECFEPFNTKAINVMNQANFCNYEKWFPQLNKDNVDYQKFVEINNKEFEEVKKVYDAIQAKRAKNKKSTDAVDKPAADTSIDKPTADPSIDTPAVVDPSADTPTADPKKKNRWDKYRK
jgi:ubiquitin-protein ligase